MSQLQESNLLYTALETVAYPFGLAGESFYRESNPNLQIQSLM